MKGEGGVGAHRCWHLDADEVQVEPSVPSVRPVSVNRKVYGRRSTLFPACLDMGWSEPNRFEIWEVPDGALVVLKRHGLNACGFSRVVTCFSSAMCWCFMSAAVVSSTGFSTRFPAAVR